LSPRSRWVEAVIAELAPEAAKKMVGEWLGSKTVKEAYQFLIEHRDDDWYDLLPKKAKTAIKRLAPRDTSWFDTTFVLAAIAEANPKLASLILGSPELKSIVADKVERLRERIAGCA